MSCESNKCDMKKALLIPDEPSEATPENRELDHPRSQDEIEYGKRWGDNKYGRLQKAYPPELWAEVKNKTHG